MPKIKGWKKEHETTETIGYTNNGNTLVEIYKVGDAWNTNISSNKRKSTFLSRKTNKTDALKQAQTWMKKHPKG